MASDPTAGGAPAEMPVESSDPNLDIPPKPEGVAAEVEQLQAEKADLQDKLLRELKPGTRVVSHTIWGVRSRCCPTIPMRSTLRCAT